MYNSVKISTSDSAQVPTVRVSNLKASLAEFGTEITEQIKGEIIEAAPAFADKVKADTIIEATRLFTDYLPKLTDDITDSVTDTIYKDFNTINDIQSLITSLKHRAEEFSTILNQNQRRFANLSITNDFQKNSIEYFGDFKNNLGSTYATGFSMIFPPTPSESINVRRHLAESSHTVPNHKDFVSPHDLREFSKIDNTFEVKLDPYLYTLVVYSPEADFGKTKTRIHYKFNPISGTLLTTETHPENFPITDTSTDSYFRVQSSLPIMVARETYIYSYQSNLTSYNHVSLLNYTMAHAVDDFRSLMATLVDELMTFMSTMQFNNPIYQEFLNNKVQNYTMLNKLAFLMDNATYFVKEPVGLGFHQEITSPGAPSSDAVIKHQATHTGFPSMHLSSIPSTKWPVPEPRPPTIIQEFLHFTMDIESIFTAFNPEVTVNSDQAIIQHIAHTTVTTSVKRRGTMLHIAHFKIEGNTLPGSPISITPFTFTLSTQESPITLNFDIVTDADGLFTATCSCPITTVDLATDYPDSVGVLIGPSDQEIKPYHKDFNLKYSFGAFQDPEPFLGEITPRFSMIYDVEPIVFDFEIFDPPKVSYIKVPLEFVEISQNETQQELQALAIRSFIKDAKQDARLQNLEYRVTELERLVTPTGLGIIGGLFSTGSIFMGVTKLAFKFEKIAQSFFILEDVVQGRYLTAIFNFGGANAGNLTRKLKRKGALTKDQDDLVGSMGTHVKRLAKAKDFESRGTNYDVAPFDIAGSTSSFVARTGEPIKQLPGSKTVNDAFLNISPSHPMYSRMMNIKEKGWMPEHQSVIFQTAATTSEGTDYIMFGRMGISEGALSHNGQLGASGKAFGDSLPSNAGVLFHIKELKTGKPRTIWQNSIEDKDLERKALLCMEGTNPEKVKNLDTLQIDAYDGRSNEEIYKDLIGRSNKMSVRTIESNDRVFDQNEFQDLVNSFSHGAFRKNYGYSVPNRTCQHFAKAAYDNILQGTESSFLPHPFERSHRYSDKEPSESQLDDMIRDMYEKIVFGRDSPASFYIMGFFDYNK